MPIPSSRCGSHIHVSPWPNRQFSLHDLHALAFGTIHYEFHVHNLLPEYRQHNKYCRPNTEHSEALHELIHVRGVHARDVWKKTVGIKDLRRLRDFMQASDEPKKDRYVLWNFDNVVQPGGSGSVEFRGGRAFRGPVRTKRWIAFVMAFVHFCLNQVRGFDLFVKKKCFAFADLLMCVRVLEIWNLDSQGLCRPGHGEVLGGHTRSCRRY